MGEIDTTNIESRSPAPITDAGALGREAGKLLLASASAAGSADVPGSGSAPAGDPTAEEILANFDLIDKDRNGWLYDIEIKGATTSASQDLRRIGEYLQNNPTIRGLVWDVHVDPDGKHAFYDGVGVTRNDLKAQAAIERGDEAEFQRLRQEGLDRQKADSQRRNRRQPFTPPQITIPPELQQIIDSLTGHQ